jgi:hypothetical protein
MKASQLTSPDPLFVIFEQHLYHFQDDALDRKTFIAQVIQDYLAFLRKKNITVPRSLEDSIIEELTDQVQAMLVKKIYGFLTIQDFRKKAPSAARRKAKVLYGKLNKRA